MIGLETAKVQLGNGETISYVETGRQFREGSPTILLIHGNLSSKEWWNDTLLLLKDFPHHVVAIDLRGFGESSYKQPCVRYKDWADDLTSFYKVVVVGWSFGGAITMKFAQVAPHLVTKVILVASMSSSGFKVPKEGGFCETREEMEASGMHKLMAARIASKDVQAVRDQWRKALLNKNPGYPAIKADMMIRSQFDQRCLLDWFQASTFCDIHLENIKASGLVIHGKQDYIIPLGTMEAAIAHFKDSIILEEGAHMIPIERPQWFVDRIKEFYEKQ